MKNDFPIKNFENFIDQVRKLGYNLLSAILVTAELVGKYIVSKPWGKHQKNETINNVHTQDFQKWGLLRYVPEKNNFQTIPEE